MRRVRDVPFDRGGNVDEWHVEDDEQDEESQQTSAEDEAVLCLQALELSRTADTLVDWVFRHPLFINGRMSAGW